RLQALSMHWSRPRGRDEVRRAGDDRLREDDLAKRMAGHGDAVQLEAPAAGSGERGIVFCEGIVAAANDRDAHAPRHRAGGFDRRKAPRSRGFSIQPILGSDEEVSRAAWIERENADSSRRWLVMRDPKRELGTE